MSRLIEGNNLLPETHFGGRPGRMTTDAVHYLVHKIKSAWRGKKVASILFLDVEGAFPNAVTDRLLHNMRKRRIPTQYINFVKQILQDRKTRLKFDDFVSEPTNIDNGIGQGDPISMLLYIIYNADLLDLCIGNNESSLGYVDDALVIATGTDFQDTTNKLKNFMERDGGAFKWGTDHNSNFEISKLAVMHCTLKREADPNNPRKTVEISRPTLTLRNINITEVKSYKYLGIHVDHKLQWKIQAQKAVAKATKWILMFRRLTKPSTGIKPGLMRQLYLAVAVPKMTYGLDVWYIPPEKLEGARHNSGSVGVQRQLGKIQRIATLAITGALRTTPSDLLDAHAGVLPIHLMLNKICHRAVARLATLPTTNPLAQILRQYYTKPAQRHLTPLHHLLKRTRYNPLRVETISPITRPPTQQHRFTTHIAEDRDTSMTDEKNDPSELRIYTDGSGYMDKIGAAAVMYKKGVDKPIKTLRYHLGTKKQHTTFEGEAVGSLLAAWMIQRTPLIGRAQITIFTDSQAFIRASKAQAAGPGQYLTKNFNELTESMGFQGLNTHNYNKFTLRWISAHSGVEGNERVDEEAKKAAEGQSSPPHTLPPILRQPLPWSVSAIKQKHMDTLNKRWRNEWKSSARYEWMKEVDPEFPYNKFRKLREQLTRAQGSLLIQIRSKHIPLNKYLHKIGKLDQSQCTDCWEIAQRRVTESLNHFLFECPAYADERFYMDQALGRDAGDLRSILNNRRSTLTLLKYIGQTRRFEKTIGNVTPSAAAEQEAEPS